MSTTKYYHIGHFTAFAVRGRVEMTVAGKGYRTWHTFAMTPKEAKTLGHWLVSEAEKAQEARK